MTRSRPLWYNNMVFQWKPLSVKTVGEAFALKIALCDDEIRQLQQVEALLEEYHSARPGGEWAVSSFSSGMSLLEHLQARGAFDVYLLDVIMPGIDGIELGVSIRELDQGGHIVYLTSSPDFAVDSYRARASDYLLKPVEEERLFQALDEIARRLDRERRDFVTVKTRDGFLRLPLGSIVCGELVRRCVHYHLSDGSMIEGISLRGSFQDAVKPLLEDSRFVLCAASFFANLSFVERIGSDGLQLADGRTLPLSRGLRTGVTGRWMDHYLGGEG